MSKVLSVAKKLSPFPLRIMKYKPLQTILRKKYGLEVTPWLWDQASLN